MSYEKITTVYDGPTPSVTATLYQSAMSPRVINVQRSRNGQMGSGVVTRIFQNMQSSSGSPAFGRGLTHLVNASGIPLRDSFATNQSMALVGMNQVRHREKRDLEQLNDKFAQYLEKVRFLEAQNRKLQIELDALRARSGQGSSKIEEMYKTEKAAAQTLIDGTKADAAAALLKAQQAEQEVKRQRARLEQVEGIRGVHQKDIENLQKQIAENEAQINLFKRRMDDLDEEGRRYKAQAQRLASEIARLQNEISNEVFLKMSAESEKIALEDEIISLRQIQEAELADLRTQHISSDLDPAQFFRNELSQAIQEIRKDYENRVEGQRNEAQGRYTALYNELIIRQQRLAQPSNPVDRRQEERFRKDVLTIQNQNGYIRAQNEDLRNRIAEIKRKLDSLRDEGSAVQAHLAKQIAEAQQRLDAANRDYADVTSMKTSLEKEITTYRDLLESQNGLRGFVDRIVTHAQQQAIENSNSRPTGVNTTITRTVIHNIGGPTNVSTTPTFSGSSLSSLVNNTVRTSVYSSDMVTGSNNH